MSSYAVTATESYSVADVVNVLRRFTTDLRMIAESSGGMTQDEVEKYGYDIEYFAKQGYLKFVDVTLFSNGEEVKAVRYTVDAESGELTSSRPGGVLWPRLTNPSLRVVIQQTQTWHDLPVTTQSTFQGKLKLPWAETSVDITHSSLTIGATRSYVSGSYGVHRQDYGK